MDVFTVKLKVEGWRAVQRLLFLVLTAGTCQILKPENEDREEKE